MHHELQSTTPAVTTTGEGLPAAPVAANDADTTAPAYADTLTGHGYAPVPLAPGVKHPTVKGWPSASFTPADFTAPGTGVGLKLGAVVAIDADTTTAELSAAALGAITTATGIPADKLALRRGTGEARRHKFAALFRLTGEALARKRGRSAAYGAGGFVEFLASGQLAVRAVIAGTDAYAWTNPGRDPESLAAADLPAIDAATLARVRERFETTADTIATRTKPGTDTAPAKGKRLDPATLGGMVGLFCGAVTCEEVLAVSGGTWIPTEDGERYALAGEDGAPGAFTDPDDPTRFYSHYHGRNFNAHELLAEFADNVELPPVPGPDADTDARARRVGAVEGYAFDTWEAFREAITDGFPAHDPDAFGDGTLTRKRAADEAARSARYARADEVRTATADAVAYVHKALTEAETDGDTAMNGDALWSALRLVDAERPVEADRFMKRAKKALGLNIGTIRKAMAKASADASDEVEGDDAVERIIAMVQDRGELFIGEGDGAAYFTGSLDADEAVVTPGRTWAVASGEFRSALRAMYYRATGRALKGQTPNDAAANLAALALDQGPTHQVYLRAGFTDEGEARRYVIDLGDDTHRAVVVSAARGVEVVDTSPVRFVRSALMRPLPTPDLTGSADDLRALVNVTDDAFVPLVAAMIDAYRADTAFPIVEYTGPSGSGKSATTTNHKALIDPGALMLRAAPKDRDALTAALRSSYVLAYNNMSRLDADLQDALCSVSTVGEGFAGRKLYTDGDEHAVQATRPVIINGISETATASDLVSRLVRIECPPFGPDRPRLTDEELAERTRAVMPRAFGFLLVTFADALVRLPGVEVSGAGLRMLSYAKLGEAVSRALGRPDGAFVEWYSERTDELSAGALEGSPAAAALVTAALAGTTTASTFDNVSGPMPVAGGFRPVAGGGSEFVGTMGELLAVLDQYGPERPRPHGWPSLPQTLTNVLKRASAALAVEGVKVEKFDMKGARGRRPYRVTYTPPAGGGTASHEDDDEF